MVYLKKDIKKLLLHFLNDSQFTDHFFQAPAAKNMHHAYLGGLLEHTLNVVRLADVVAGLYSSIDRSLLIAGAMLHDIGKIGTYEAILNKPEELTKDEFNLIKLHPEKGAEMLSAIKQLKEIVPSIKYHHERYDGQGYPDGLKGEEIPVLSRILCVADAVDSMLADRPYRKGMPMSEIVAELRKGSGTQFDPSVIDAFLKTLK